MEKQIKQLKKPQLQVLALAMFVEFSTVKGVRTLQDLFALDIGDTKNPQPYTLNGILASLSQKATASQFVAIGAESATVDPTIELQIKAVTLVGQLKLQQIAEIGRQRKIKALKQQLAEKQYENRTEQDIINELKELGA